jgi:drug/metabolite transporter (DMT)-like permease
MQKYKVYLVLMMVMLFWGFNVSATKVLVTHFAPLTMTSFRILTAGLTVLFLLKVMKVSRKLHWKELAFITFVGLFNVVGHHFFLSLGLQKTTATNGGLIMGLAPLMSTVLAILFLGTRLTGIRFIGIALGLTGVGFVVLNGGGAISSGSLGDLFVFISLFVQAISYVFIRKASATIDGRMMTGWMLVTGAGFLFVISLFMEPDGLATMATGDIGLWAIFLASAVLATAVGHTVYNQAVQHIGAAESAIFVNLSPFFALVGSSLFLGENIHLQQLLGFLFIIIGVLCGSGVVEKVIKARKRSVNISA